MTHFVQEDGDFPGHVGLGSIGRDPYDRYGLGHKEHLQILPMHLGRVFRELLGRAELSETVNGDQAVIVRENQWIYV